MVRNAIWGIAAVLVACGGAQKTAAPAAKAPKAGGIHGVVVDVVTGSAMSFVTVIAKADGKTQTYSHTTDGAGRFVLEGLPAGKYQVIATYGRYTTQQLDVPVNQKRVTRVRLGLNMHNPQPVVQTYRPTPAIPEPKKRIVAGTTSGAIEGIVRNAKTNELMPGAVVGASSTVLEEPRLAIADDDGRYRLAGLPPGTYVLSVYYTVIERGNVELRRSGVKVAGGKATIIDLELDTERY